MFKPGQKVMCLMSYSGEFTEGKIYTVGSHDFDKHYISIELDDKGSKTNAWATKYFVDAETYLHEQAFNKTWNEMMESEVKE
jgi:hypothetical protein